jgi:hypothetical protein
MYVERGAPDCHAALVGSWSCQAEHGVYRRVARPQDCLTRPPCGLAGLVSQLCQGKQPLAIRVVRVGPLLQKRKCIVRMMSGEVRQSQALEQG